MNRIAYVLLSLSIAACNATSNTGGGNNDAGTSGGNDVVTAPSDSGTTTRTDSGTTTRTDSGTTTRTDSGSSTADAGINFGRCGRSVASRLCMCGMDQSCGQAAITSSNTCLQCVVAAQQTCCPMELDAVQQCATDRMCMDQNCVNTMCAMQITAANRCLMNTIPMAIQSGTGACFMAYTGCLGDLAVDTSICSSL